MISPEDLRYFIEVSGILNLSRAAERLGISQPSLSAAMQRLERLTKARLLVRHKKGVSLTPAGGQLLAHAKRLQECWELVQGRVSLANEALQGRFVVGCHSAIALTYFGKFLPSLLEKYRKLTLQLKHDISRKILEGVLNSSIDIGIIVNPVKHPQLIMHKLYEDETAFWCVDSQQKKQTVFSDEALIICDPDLIQVQSLLKKIEKKGLSYGRILSSSSLEVVADLTANGCGVGILPASVAQYTGKLKKISHAPSCKDEIYLVYRPENRELKAIQLIVSAIKSFFNPN